jgi:hypothetical protein
MSELSATERSTARRGPGRPDGSTYPDGDLIDEMHGTFGTEPVVAWSRRKGAAALFRRSEATRLARRMRRLRIRTTVEAA